MSKIKKIIKVSGWGEMKYYSLEEKINIDRDTFFGMLMLFLLWVYSLLSIGSGLIEKKLLDIYLGLILNFIFPLLIYIIALTEMKPNKKLKKIKEIETISKTKAKEKYNL